MRRAIGMFRMMARCLLGIVALAAISLALPGSVKADTYSVSVWLNTSAASNAKLPAPSGTADVTFTTTAINFQLGGTQADATVGQWLSSLIGGTESNITYNNGASASSAFTTKGDLVNGSYVLFTGSTGLAAGTNSFTVHHDDGASLYIGSTQVFSAPGPTSEETSTGTYNAAANGVYGFSLAYGEVNGTPAIIDFAPNPVPEPSTLAIAGLGALGFGAYHYRRRRRTGKASA